MQTNKLLQAFVSVTVLALAFWYFFGGGLERQASENMETITSGVAMDVVAQYEIAKRNGDVSDVCAKSQLAAEAFLQAKDEANYKKWKALELADCANAGIQ